MAVLAVTANSEASLRSQVAAAADGDTVTVPAGTYALTAPITVASKGIRIIGEGKLSNITQTNLAQNAFNITNAGPPAGINQRLEISDLKITGNGNGVSGSTTNLAGIGFTNTAGQSFNAWALRRITISGFNDGINLDNSASLLGEKLTIEDCQITTHIRWGISVNSMAQPSFLRNSCNGCGSNGLRVISCIVPGIYDHSSEGCNISNGTSVTGNAQTLIKLCHQFRVGGHYTENMPTAAGATKIALCISNCNGGVIDGLWVQDTALQLDTYMLRLVESAKGVNLNSLSYSKIAYPISTDDTSIYPSVLPRNVIKTS